MKQVQMEHTHSLIGNGENSRRSKLTKYDLENTWENSSTPKKVSFYVTGEKVETLGLVSSQMLVVPILKEIQITTKSTSKVIKTLC